MVLEIVCVTMFVAVVISLVLVAITLMSKAHFFPDTWYEEEEKEEVLIEGHLK